MRKFFLMGLLAILAIAMVGCAHGPMNGYPPSYDSENYSEIVIKRPSKFKGGGVNIQLTLDGKIIYALLNGEEIVFNVTSGEHRIGVTGISPWTYQVRPHELLIDFKPGMSYCFAPQVHLNIAPTIEFCSQ